MNLAGKAAATGIQVSQPKPMGKAIIDTALPL
jgi:hypothetical protein